MHNGCFLFRMSDLAQYHLHADDQFKLHFEIEAAKPYVAHHGDHTFIPHTHSFYQLIWFKEAGTHFVDYETIEHPKNAIFFLNKNQVHAFCKDSPNEGFLFHFNDVFLHKGDAQADLWMHYKLFNEIGSPYVVAELEELNAITNLTACLLIEIGDKEYNHEQQIYYLFRTILLKVERLKHVQHPDFLDTDLYLKKAVEFKSLLDKNLHQNYSVEDYADMVGLTSKTLTNYTKKYFGQTPANMIQNRKILEAKRMLSNRQRSIQEIAFELGYEQPTYFTKIFKKDTGLTPKQFAKKIHP